MNAPGQKKTVLGKKIAPDRLMLGNHRKTAEKMFIFNF